MISVMKELVEKGFIFLIMAFEKEPLLTIMMWPKGDPKHTLTAPVLSDESDEDMATTLRRLEEEFYERGWAERSLL